MKVKKEKRLNVLTSGFLPFRFCNLWYNFCQIFRNIKYAWQRITKGYCDRDLWDLCSFYSQLFTDTLEDFAKDLHSCPNSFYDDADEEWSVQKWKDYINTMSKYFYNSIESNEVYKNNIKPDFSACVDNELVHHYLDTSEDAENIRKKWFEAEKENYKKRSEDLYKGLEMLQKVFKDLWD